MAPQKGTSRAENTYRGARKNAAGRDWAGATARYEPYKTKPDRFSLVNKPDGTGLMRVRHERPQPKVYPKGWRSPAERTARLASFAAPVAVAA